MKATKVEQKTTPISVPIAELMIMLGCGRVTAEKIGVDADARFKVGRRTLYNVQKVQAYIDNLGGVSDE